MLILLLKTNIKSASFQSETYNLPVSATKKKNVYHRLW